MPSQHDQFDPLDAVPAPEVVRTMLAETVRRRDLLRSLLRVAVYKANYPPASPHTTGLPLSADRQEGTRG